MAANREETIVDEALDLPLEGRTAFLERACAGDGRLRQLVDALLKAHHRAPGLVAGPRAPAASDTTLGGPAPLAEKVGDQIGRYKLLQMLGEGGCGVVYMAEQKEPLDRRVALKVIKLGMDTRQVIARFEAEQQALALMDHPNIAKVLDAGATATGRPYFVMELVRGIKITDYCDQNELPTRERLDLFILVCRAIQHAHQKGIIHRDIKPSNILVTLHDGVPVPKVIDFGIAKAIQQRLTDKTLFTAFEQFVGTPAYMSPEQAEMSGLDIDTRSDIYSLGVLLYELLTGQIPFDAKALQASGLDAIRRLIREQDPVRPSTRLSSLAAADQTNVAKRRQADPPKLISLVQGDLDWIAMKCLEKDRARRYETANNLASDVQRHLDNQAVLARPPSAAYLFQKLLRRNKLAFAALGAVALAVLLGLGLSTWMLVRERAAAQRHSTAAKFLRDMFGSIDPAEAMGQDTTLLRRILERKEKDIESSLRNQPAVAIDLLNTIGQAYENLGEYHRSKEALRKAADWGQTAFGARSLEVATSLDLLSAPLWKLREWDTAVDASRKSLAVRRELLKGDHAEIAQSLNNLGVILTQRGDLSNAEPYLLQALAMEYRLYSGPHEQTAETLTAIGTLLFDAERWKEAELTNALALAMHERVQGRDDPGFAMLLQNQGTVLRNLRRLGEAEKSIGTALEIQRRILGTNHHDTIVTEYNLAGVLYDARRFSEAAALYARVIEQWRAVTSETNSLGLALVNLALTLYNAADLERAEPVAREALTLQTKNFGQEHRETMSAVRCLAGILWKQGQLEEAERLYRRLVEYWREPPHQDLAGATQALNDLGTVLRDAGKAVPAVEAHQTALELQGKLVGSPESDRAVFLNNLAAALRDAGRLAEAETNFIESARILKSAGIESAASFIQVRNNLAGLLVAAGKFSQAESIANDCIERGTNALGISKFLVAASEEVLAEALQKQGKLAQGQTMQQACLNIREQLSPGHWRKFDAQNRLGDIFLEEEKFLEAEPLLSSGYEGLRKLGSNVTVQGRASRQKAGASLIHLYEASGRIEAAAKVRAQLTAETTQLSPTNSAPRP